MLKFKNDRFALSSKCAIYGSKKSRMMKKQELKRLLSNFGIRIPQNKIPLLVTFCFN